MIDILWLLVCSGLVFLMQPGFMCLESGLTRSKNSINVAVKNLADFGISVAGFWIFGYAVMFGASLGGWIGSTHFFLDVSTAPELAAFFLFQVMFCSTATTIVSGAIAERMKFRAYLIVAGFVSCLIYPVFGHWVWNGANAGTLGGWLGQLGFVDFAGSTVVHGVGGWVSLAALMVVGPRAGRFPYSGRSRKIRGSNMQLSVLGAMLLWFGWLGFNGGSTLSLNGLVPSIMVNTILAGVAGMVAAGTIGWQQRKLPEVEVLINGSIAGLVAITASCHAVTTPHAVVIGFIGGAVMMLVVYWMERAKIDDAVDAVAVHAGAGAWGTLAVALFGQPELLETGLSRSSQLLVQLLGIVVGCIWAFGASYVALESTNRLFALRVSVYEEKVGLNISEHRAKTEIHDLFEVMDAQAKTQNLSLRVPVEPFTEAGQIASRYNQVMDALEEAVTQTEAIVTTATDAILTFSLPQLNILTANPSSELVFGYPTSTLKQMSLPMLMELPNAVDNWLPAGRYETIARRADGLLFPLEMTVTKAQLGRRSFYTGMFRDIKERKQAEEALVAANREISALNHQLTAENLRLNAEIEVTRQLQQMLLPNEAELEAIAPLEIAGFMEPAAEVGGDYYDVLEYNGRVKIGIGDVTGHGLESGVLMIMVQTAVRTLLESNETDPKKFLEVLNRTIYDNVQRMNSDKNLSLSLIDYQGGTFSLSGQHEYAIIVRAGGEIELIDTLDLGFPIGLEEDIADFVMSTQVQLRSGDGLVLYTDGITEAENLDKIHYGLERLCEVVRLNWQLSAKEIRQVVIDDLRSHIGSQKVYDDLTLVVLKQK